MTDLNLLPLAITGAAGLFTFALIFAIRRHAQARERDFEARMAQYRQAFDKRGGGL